MLMVLGWRERRGCSQITAGPTLPGAPGRETRGESGGRARPVSPPTCGIGGAAPLARTCPAPRGSFSAAAATARLPGENRGSGDENRGSGSRTGVRGANRPRGTPGAPGPSLPRHRQPRPVQPRSPAAARPEPPVVPPLHRAPPR